MDCRVIGFVKEFECLNLELKKMNEKMFDMALIIAYDSELRKGFIVERQYKTTKTGTKFKYKACESEEEATLYTSKINNLIKNFNEKYGTDYDFQ